MVRLQEVVHRPLRSRWVGTLAAGLLVLGSTWASDHGDTPLSAAGPRTDANLTDLHAFVVGQNLVLALSVNPAIPPSAASYVFPTDVTFEIAIDVDADVEAADPEGNGGTILQPHRINEDVSFRVRFNADGSARLQRIGGNRPALARPVLRRLAGSVSTPDAVSGPVALTENDALRQGGSGNDPGVVGFFTGLRDDPFIRGPRQGRNVAAIVIEVPLASILRHQSTLVIWATSTVEELDGQFQDLAGRALKSMFPENAEMNTLHPRHHVRELGSAPDVLIFDTALPAAFPNGRALVDDVVDIVGDSRVLGNDAPFPTENDLPFLATFPYLAPPHSAP